MTAPSGRQVSGVPSARPGGVRESRRRPTGAGVGVVVPADWWVVPLADEAGRGRVIAAMVDHQVGRADLRADLRRQLRVSLGSAARNAAASGGWVMAFMVTRAGDLPLPATLTGYRAPGTFADDAGVDRLREALTEHVSGCPHGRLDVGDGPFGLVLRAVRERPGPAMHAVQDIPVLISDYWSDPGDGHGLAHLSFSTPLVDLRSGFVDLFDAIAGTLYRFDDA